MTHDELIRRGREAAPAMLDLLRDVVAAGVVVEMSRRVARRAGPGDQMLEGVLLALAAGAGRIVAEIDGETTEGRRRPFRKDDRVRVATAGGIREGVVASDQLPGHTVVAVRFDGLSRIKYRAPECVELIPPAPTETAP